ncbi:MAG TPA: hypothetical protein VJ505_11450 [Holophagaceae bacterium]|nr:hypothetical protein [Holophagaceae bacterium]
MILLALALQSPPPAWEEGWRPGRFWATLPPIRLDLPEWNPTGRSQAKGRRTSTATVEVVAPGMTEEFTARTQLRLDLTAVARDMFSLSGSGSLEGRVMLATFATFDASNIQGLANAQTKALQELFNPPRVRPTWGAWSLDVKAEPHR